MGIRECRQVLSRRPRCDYIEWVADDVGNDEAVQGPPAECLGQLAPFDL